jgi:hypothetical protein
MKFTYFELIERPLEINFDEVFEAVSKETSEDYYYEEFCDNFDYYIRTLYNVELDDECNISLYDEVLGAWEEYLNNKNDNSNKR